MRVLRKHELEMGSKRSETRLEELEDVVQTNAKNVQAYSSCKFS